MNIRFLKEISEAYVIDNHLDITPSQIYNELYEMVKFLQKYDPELYQELYELTHLRQQQILSTFMDNYCYEENIKTYNELIFNDELYDEYFSEGFISSTGESISKLFDLIKEYPGPSMAASSILLSLLILFNKPISKATFSVLYTVGNGINKIGKFLSKHGTYMKMRYAIIQQNSKNCYVRCGLSDPTNISSFSYLAVVHAEHSKMLPLKAIKQAMCLRDCYLNELIELISINMENYFACIKNTGSSNVNLQSIDSDDILKMVAHTNISTVCQVHYELASDAIKFFYICMDSLFVKGHDDDIKLKWMNALRNKIYTLKQTIQKADSQQLKKYIPNNNDFRRK